LNVKGSGSPVYLIARRQTPGRFASQREQNGNENIAKPRFAGVGFFDRAHGATGAAPNAIELHPVLKVEFVSGISNSGVR